MENKFITKGVCSKEIHFNVENGIITRVQFFGGCDGNTRGLEKLLVGFTPEEAVKRLSGITCGDRPTSCPDQFAQALIKHIKEKNTL